LIDSDPEAALEHARYAKAKASRVPIVREALGLVSYHAGNWAEALSELRAVRRMTRADTHIAVIADAERALGRPERALDLAKEAAGSNLPREVEVELRIVAAGARRDMGQLDAAVVSLQGPDLNPAKRDPWSARLFYAYADNLAAAGRRDEAIEWFLNAAQADEDEETDAADRAAALSNDDLPVGDETPEIDEDVVADRDPEVLNEALAEDLEDDDADAAVSVEAEVAVEAETSDTVDEPADADTADDAGDDGDRETAADDKAAVDAEADKVEADSADSPGDASTESPDTERPDGD
jgi:tetratricopeptide (TPR) repeat protein